jgi:hypothetical protein
MREGGRDIVGRKEGLSDLERSGGIVGKGGIIGWME